MKSMKKQKEKVEKQLNKNFPDAKKNEKRV